MRSGSLLIIGGIATLVIVGIAYSLFYYQILKW